MTEIDDEAFKAIKDSIPPEYEDPTEEQQKAIDKLDRHTGFNPTPGVTRKVALLVQEASEVIMQRYRFLTIEETKEILVYDNGAYKTGGETLIGKILEAEYAYELNNNILSQIIGHVMRRTYHKREEIDADINFINLKNGLYNLKSGLLEPHTPDHFSINQKPLTYDKDAKPRLFFKFLNEVLYPSDVRTVLELFAYTFYKDNPFEIITNFLGSGANGKNVLLGILTALHGIDNVSNVSMKSIIDERFALAGLEGKNVNIDTELSSVTIKDTATLKKLTGRQRIRVEWKNQDPYETKLYSKLFFNANQVPLTYDDSDAYFRRNILIQLPNQFVEESDDPSAKIADPFLLEKLVLLQIPSSYFWMKRICSGRENRKRSVMLVKGTSVNQILTLSWYPLLAVLGNYSIR
jgi:P4 family phage/plasmid primase-like protien